jgi:hypothetical protein
MENNLFYTPFSSFEGLMLLNKGFEQGDSTKSDQNFVAWVVNVPQKTFWAVDQTQFNNTNNLVTHLTGNEIQPYTV